MEAALLSVSEYPTATHSVTLEHATPWRTLMTFGAFALGLGTTDQLLPFQLSIKVDVSSGDGSVWPTATQSLAAGHETPRREEFVADPEESSGLGLG
jgi:hypothetical protein